MDLELSMGGKRDDCSMLLNTSIFIEATDAQGASFFGYMGIAAALVFCSKY